MDHTEAVETLAPERYLMNEMTVEDREAFEEHYFGCAECAADLRAGSAVIAGVRARKVVHQPKPWAFWTSTAAAALLAVIIAYQTSVIIPEARARHEESQQALVVHQVLPLSTGDPRGSEEQKKIHAGQPFTLSVDVEPVVGAAGYDIEIADARGANHGRWHISAEAAKDSTQIVVPGGTLPAGRYTLNVMPKPAVSSPAAFEIVP